MAGVAFKKTFSYAGFEMQPKKYKNPKIALLNVELELKAEKDNAEIRVHTVEVGSPAGVRRQATFWMRASFLYVVRVSSVSQVTVGTYLPSVSMSACMAH